MWKINKLLFLLIIAAISTAVISCSMIDEGDCRVKYIDYQYRNNIGKDATHQISKMTDFIFTKDSVLYRVDDNIVNGHRRRRPINLPDGEWIVVTYGNMDRTEGSAVKYTLGRTRFSEMMLRVKRPSSYAGSYASETIEPKTRIGDSDKLYFGKVNFEVKDGAVDRKIVVEMSNVHIWLHATVRWNQSPPTYGDPSALHVRLEFVPVEHSFMTDSKNDKQYNIPFFTPRTTPESVSHVVRLWPVTSMGNKNEFSFNAYGLRWKTNEAPTLRFYNGSDRLVAKDLDLNYYFADQRIDLTNVRQQFYELLIEINGESVSISPVGLSDWDDGGGL